MDQMLCICSCSHAKPKYQVTPIQQWQVWLKRRGKLKCDATTPEHSRMKQCLQARILCAHESAEMPTGIEEYMQDYGIEWLAEIVENVHV